MTRSSGYVAMSSSSHSLSDESTLTPQLDPIDREALADPVVTANKEGVYQCKKHGSSGACSLWCIRSLE